jgi:transposase, IS5 family
LQQGVVLEPPLKAITDFLDNHEELTEAIRGDLRRGLKNPATGRKGLTAQQVLRSLILMRVKNWDYRELRERIADGFTLRRFTDFYSQPVPKHDAFQRAFIKLTPQTLKSVNELLVQAAVAMGLEDGSKLRVDTTVVQTNIHHPTDNTLLWDVVRVVTRLVSRLAMLIERPIKGFCNRRRAARRRMQALQRMSTQQRQTKQRGKYRELISVAEEVVEAGRRALRQIRNIRIKDLFRRLALAELQREIDRYCSLGQRVIDQTRRRVLQGEQVSNVEKIYSIFEPTPI